MSYDNLVPALVEFGKKAVGAVLWMLKRYWLIAIVAAVMVSMIMSGLPWLNQQRIVNFTLLDGPAGGTGRDLATRLGKEIAGRSSPYGYQYAVHTVHTNGFEDNRRRISEDTTRRTFGFAHDGFGDTDSINVLLPLEKSYLHILARREFLAEHGLVGSGANDPSPAAADASATRSSAIALSEVCKLLKPGKAFLGPKGSGTEQVARTVLEFYQLEPTKYQCHGITDWHDLRSALNTKVIDVGFYCGRIGADAMISVMHDRTAVLLNLGDDAQAIRQVQPQFMSGTIERESYRQGSDFCGGQLQTLATRRVLICPRAMTPADAFLLTKAAESALLPIADVNESSDPVEVARGLRFRLHEGARAALDDKPLSYLPPGLLVFLTAIGLAVAVELVRFVTAWIPIMSSTRQTGDSGAASATANSPAPGYEGLSADLTDLLLDLETTTHPFTAEARERLIARLGRFREQMKESVRAGKLNDTQRESLLNGFRAALQEMRRTPAIHAGAFGGNSKPPQRETADDQALTLD